MTKFKTMACTNVNGIKHLFLVEKNGIFKKIGIFKFFVYLGEGGYFVSDLRTGVSIIPPQKTKEEAITLAKINLKKFLSFMDTVDYITLCDRYQKMQKYSQLEFNF